MLLSRQKEVEKVLMAENDARLELPDSDKEHLEVNLAFMAKMSSVSIDGDEELHSEVQLNLTSELQTMNNTFLN